MKRLIGLILLVSLVLTLIGVWYGFKPAPSPRSDSIHVSLRSEPYPMIIGQANLYVALTDADGIAIEGAEVSLVSQMAHPGAPEMFFWASEFSNGEYRIPVFWSSMGQARIQVTALLPQAETPFQEEFPLYVHTIPPYQNPSPSPYVSQAELRAWQNHPTEYWIYIPQGTAEMYSHGTGDDIVPPEIRLQLSGKHTIVIRNDDLVDHTIGPFFVKAGEIVRQEFTRAAVFQGVCTVSHGAVINIVVEE